jgi:XTP/dITP diphosphohydrolase
MTRKLLIASGNQGKLREINGILSPLALEILSTQDINLDIEVEETGSTYGENAHLKAVTFHTATGLAVLADDSGLEVDILGGAPGIYSARFSPKSNPNDADRRSHLLSQLKGKPQPWTAHFHCTAVLILPSGEYIQTSGRCDGVIIHEERGTNGFGYDAVFFLPEYNATMAQLPGDLKNQISHRAKALSAMLPVITQRWSEN